MNIDTHLILLQVQNKYRALFILILMLIVSHGYAAELPEDIRVNGELVTDLIYKEDFKTAEETARKIIKKYPDNPAGYFFLAAALDAWMGYYFDKKKENEFYKYCDLTIEKSEEILNKAENDEWAIFFMGGAEGYKGTYEARYERWITSFRYGWRGVSTLMKLSDMKSDIVDVNYGIGYYDYWRSALIKTLWFMPNVKDRRDDGIKKLYMSAENGILTKLASYAALVDILINENRVEDALRIAEKMLIKYPSSSMFLWGKARALYGVGRFDEARSIFLMMLKKYESDEVQSTYYPVLCHYWLARIDFAQEKYGEAVKEAQIMEKYSLSDDLKKLLERYFSEMSDLKKNSRSKLGKS